MDKLSFKNGEVALQAVVAGPQHGPVVVLLHGFPEFCNAWRRQIEPLAAAGFRVIVPDQRGYNLSSKPSGVAAYALTELVSDVMAIADQLAGRKSFSPDTTGERSSRGAPPCFIRSASPSSPSSTFLIRR